MNSIDDKAIALRGAVWMTVGGENLGGHGRIDLLAGIHATGSITQAAIQCQHASTPFGDTGAMKRPRHPPSRGRYPQLVRTERCETAERTDTRSHGLIGHGRHAGQRDDAKHGSHGPSIAACFIAPRPFRPG